MLEDYPKKMVTKGGLAVVLRPVVPEDEEALRKMLSQIPEEERWFLRENLTDSDRLRQWIATLNYEHVLPMIAVKEDDGEIIANLRLYRSSSGCTAHVAHVRIMVVPAYRSQKIGSLILTDAAKLATELGVEKLIAEFVSDVENVAMKAADRLDFHREAVLKDYVLDPHGGCRDLIIMVKNLSREWHDF